MKPSILAAVSQRDPVWIYPVVLGGLALISFLLWFLNRFYPSKKGYHGSVGNALMRMEASFLPGREPIVEAAERDDAEEEDQGEPPETGMREPDQRN
jgi:hypothetical protein